MGIDANFWESLYFIYCLEMNRPENEFFKSTTAKILRMIEIKYEGFKTTNITTASTMRGGFLSEV